MSQTDKNYSHKSLIGENLSGVHLEGALFRHADLSRTNLNVAYLNDADLAYANLDNASLGQLGSLSCIDLSPDGAWLATASGQGEVKIWEISTGRETYNLTPSGPPIYDIAFSPDGKVLAASCWDHTVKLWDVSSRWNLRELEGHEGDVNGIAFHPDGKLLASGSDDGTTIIWDIQKNIISSICRGQKGDWIRCVAFSHDGRWLATGSEQGLVRIWNVMNGSELRVLRTRKSRSQLSSIMGLSFSPDGRYLAAGEEFSESVTMWDSTANWKSRSFKCSDPVDQLCFSSDGKSLLMGCWGSLEWWDIDSLSHLRSSDDVLAPFSMSRDGRIVAAEGSNNVVKIIDFSTGDLIQEIRQELHCIRTNIL